MTPTLISIGTGNNQLPLIRAAKDLGFDVIGLGTTATPEVVPLLSAHLPVTTHQPEAALTAVNQLRSSHQIRGVLIRTSGPALTTAAAISTALDVPGVSESCARCAVSKSQLRKTATALDIPTPQGVQRAQCAPPPFALPWIIKPDVPFQGKKNVFAVSDQHEYQAAFAAAVAESGNGMAEVNQLIPGIDVGYGVLVTGGTIQHDFMYDEYVAFPSGRAHGLGVGGPSIVAGTAVAPQIRIAALRLLDVWNFDHGFAFFSFRVTRDGQPFLYEANPGLCGDDIADQLLPAMWPGLNPFTIAVRALTGQDGPWPAPTTGFHAVFNGHLTHFDSENQRLKTLASLIHGHAPAHHLTAIAAQLARAETP